MANCDLTTTTLYMNQSPQLYISIHRASNSRSQEFSYDCMHMRALFITARKRNILFPGGGLEKICVAGFMIDDGIRAPSARRVV